MTEYGVQTNNIFDLLNAAEDPAKPAGAAKPKARKKKSQRGKGGAPSGQPQGQGQAAKPKDTTQAGPKPTQQRPPSAQPRVTTVTVSGGRGSAPRAPGAPSPTGGRGNNQGGGRGGQGGARTQAPRLASGSEEFVRRHDDSHVSFAEERRKPDNSRRDEGRKQQQAPNTAPARGREFDRHSGTGRSPVENKKGGSGQANWGKLDGTDELAGTEDANAELHAESPEAKKEEHKKKKKKKGKKGEEEKEEEKKDEIPEEQLKTLDDFLKEKSAKAVKLTLPPARTAGEGVKIDPKWAEAVKREDTEDLFVKPKEEPKKEEEDNKKPSKSSMRKKRKKEAKEQQAKKLAEENIVNMFDFSAKKENEFPRGGRGRGRGPREDRGPRPPREGGSGRGPRPPREGGSGRGPRGGGGGGSGRGYPQPKKYAPGAAAEQGAQFDDSAFPALQVGPPPITVD